MKDYHDDIGLQGDVMPLSWQDSIYRQRQELAEILREPLAHLAERCTPVWGDRRALDEVLVEGFASIPYCTYLYILGTDGVQISDNVGRSGLSPEHYGRDRSQRPYMKEPIPPWGYLLSDAYITQSERRPSARPPKLSAT